MNNEKIFVVLIEVGEQPKLVEVENTLERFQQMVGGYIEPVYFSRKLQELGINVIVDEEGVLKNKIPSAIMVDGDRMQVLQGSVVLVGTNGEDFGGLTKEQIEILSNEVLRFGDVEIDVKQDGEVLGTIDVTTIIA